ncbi:nuclease-related domain-containing protein [Candidatus Nitrosacidococcus sp. I8]|uniref:nuclease-related domain-containing protein n=1 Tax=Candidatus Nitrosacidococcus sp. I8 TaxID=2942908 RepID=UPI00222725C8|nr:nuclease-related domain-containing protein [Candidatus Nitrosacidococcus sp. I8]CAH9018686.1 hypothetical protein NURINAE_01073 [Candidatus Nitrosacidococcus sp. I8]
MLNLVNIAIQFWWVWLLLIVILYVKSKPKSPQFKGSIGEKIIKQSVIWQLPKDLYISLHDIYIKDSLGTTQIDHLIVSPYGLFVIETKHMKGWIFGKAEDKSWTQKLYKQSHTFQNPLRQNYRHQKALAETLNLNLNSIYSVIVFTGDCQLKGEMPPNVFQGMSYIKYIRSFEKRVFTEHEKDKLVELIKTERLPNTRAIRKEHLRELQKKYS